MLLTFNDIVQKYRAPKGIIHIGAHLMEERADYLRYGFRNTIWIEANPNIYEQIKERISNTEEKVFQFAASDIDDQEIVFNITNNGQSSSILELEKHSIYYPSIVVTDKISVKTRRMDTLIKNNHIDIHNYNFINIDVQGAELLVMKGFGELLNNIDFIYSEINTNSLYKNCSLVEEIDEYLLGYGFYRTETLMTECEWGDALYIRRKNYENL
jgi:FkbM family methyltransferase